MARVGYPHLPCFTSGNPSRNGQAAIDALRSRFLLHSTEDYMRKFVSDMVRQSLNSLTTRLYDNYQYYANGIQ